MRFFNLTLGTLFILSGATGLIYQTLWIRILSLGVGSTSASMSLVLAIFFLGLSLGSYGAGRLIDRVKKPLQLYALIELFIGLYSFAIIYPLFNFHKLLALLPLDGAFSWAGIAAKFILVALMLVLPTAAMGATLPILVRIFTREKSSSVGSDVSLLYGINTLGAVIGAFSTSFWLIPTAGILVTNHLAAATNVVIAVIAIVLERKYSIINSVTAEEAARPVGSISLTQKLIIAACGVCGFVSIASEVVWNKYLGIFFGTNIYGLGLVLALYLLGIALGSLVLTFFIERVKNKLELFIQLFIASTLVVSTTTYLFNFAPIGATLLDYFVGGSVSLLTLKSLVMALLLFVPTCIFGALLPLAINLITRDKREAPAGVGLAYSVNTVGAILGSYLAGIVLIPHVGSSMTIRIVALVSVVMIGLLVYHGITDSRRRKVYFGVTAAVALGVLLMGNLKFDNILKTAYHQTAAGKTFAQATRYFSDKYEEFRLVIEGETSIISLSHDPKDGEYYRKFLRLKTNGLNESVYNELNREELPRYEALLGLLPYLFAPDPRNAFIVGYGGGFTVDFLTSTDVPKVHVVELEKGVLQVADFVNKGNNPLLKRKNLDLRVEDARYVLASKLNAPLDIIVSQPSHSWLSGAANLFTEEFFTIVKDNLSERGVFSQWLNLYNMDVTVLKSILRTFYSVFPHGAVFTNGSDQELILLGSREPLQLNIERLTRVANNLRYQKKLGALPLKSPADLLAHFALEREDALAAVADAPINTDVNAYAETRQSRLFYRGVAEANAPQTFLTSLYQGQFEKLLPLTGDALTDFRYQVLASLHEGNHPEKFFVAFDRFEKENGADPKHAAQLGYLCLKAQRYESALGYLRTAYAQKATGESKNLILSALVETERYNDVIKLANQNPSLNDKVTNCYVGHAYLRTNNLSAASRILDPITNDISGYTQACGQFLNKLVGDYFYAKEQFRTAIPFYEAYHSGFASDVEVLRKMVIAYLSVNDWTNAKSFSGYLPTALDGELKELTELVKYYEQHRLFEDARVLSARASSLKVN